MLAEGAHGEALAGNEVDSDDASDAYSSGDDEDEPLAEVMDELERVAGDLDADAEDDAEDSANKDTGPSVHGDEAPEDALDSTVRSI